MTYGAFPPALPAVSLLPWWREAGFMTDAADALPPPFEHPMSVEAPDRLKFFIYYLTHDFMPLGAVEYALARARDSPESVQPGPASDFADQVARQLMYDPAHPDR